MAESRPRVLVVDDERFFREAILEALAEAGIDCDAAESGTEALRIAHDPQVGVVVLDMTLEDVSGIDVLRRLRADRPGLRVIVLSDHTDEDLVLEALRLDASDYLAKPLHDEELVLAVRRALGAFDVESSWQRLRERVGRLETRLGELLDGPAARSGDAEAFGALAAKAVAEVLDAGKTSIMLFDDEENELRVIGAHGSGLAAAEMNPVALGEGVAGFALARGEPLLVDDVYLDARFADRTVRDRYESSSLAVVPLCAEDHLLGVFCATDRPGGAPFGDDDLALLKILARPATSFLARLSGIGAPADAELRASDRASEAEREEAAIGSERAGKTRSEAQPEIADANADADAAADAELVREICEAMTVEVEPGRMLDGAMAAVARRVGGEVMALHLIDNPTGELVLERQAERGGCSDRERLPRDRGLTGVVLQTGSLVATDHPERDPRFDPEIDTAADGVPRPLLCVPLRLRGKVLGLFRGFPDGGADGAARTGELLGPALSAAIRTVLLYRSLLESIDEVADARREAGTRIGR
jgi:CheY-like chemotaxis protein/GAF domain-containing protein